ncbi:hypothetical protein BTR14_08755 [Rhizobium rhizosphaerae]|uniref:Uncharacterized protein n=1 Tax=Xaviernesmea rhizosphaerae TaxID=1672749 RepID=A0ABX3PEV3_9HYPH|nr:hypothetical protein BTR14_08755 [Xaviernesmea rhizosphaerae]
MLFQEFQKWISLIKITKSMTMRKYLMNHSFLVSCAIIKLKLFLFLMLLNLIFLMKIASGKRFISLRVGRS